MVNEKNDLAISFKSSIWDHIINTAKAVLSGMPIPGAGSVASLMADYIPSKRKKMIEQFMFELKEELSRFGDRLSEKINNDEFYELYVTCAKGAVNTTRLEKIKAFSKILANHFLKSGDSDKKSFMELDQSARVLDNLSYGALEVLAVIHKYYGNQRDIGFDFGEFNQKIVSESIQIPEASRLLSLLNELNSYNIIHMPGVPQIRDSRYWNYSFEYTDYGREFVERLPF